MTESDNRVERLAIEALLSQQDRLVRLKSEGHLAARTSDGAKFGSWLVAAGDCQIAILERSFDAVDVWSSLAAPTLPEGAEAERDHLICVVRSLADRNEVLVQARRIASNRPALREQITADQNMSNESLAHSASDNQSALSAVALDVFNAVSMFAGRVAELNAQLSMEALQIAAERQGLTATAIPQIRQDDGSWSMGMNIDFQRDRPNIPRWRFWRRRK